MMVGLETPSTAYKPFRYPWAHDMWRRQQQVHWMPEEVPLGEDIKDWSSKLTQNERDFLTAIFRFFTQADLDVNENYMETYAGIFKPHEVKMMLSAFSNIETVHVAAYALLIDTVGMPESEFATFLEYEEMREKHEMSLELKRSARGTDKLHQLVNMAAFGAFTEGMQLFASFAMLMNFQRFGKMKGMCQIVEWSIRDESLHAAGVMRLFREYRHELGWDNSEALKNRIRDTCQLMVAAEIKFIDLAFRMGQPEGLTKEEMVRYVQYIADLRMEQLGYEPIYHIGVHPLPWLVELINGVEHANFFETRSTEYSKGALLGSWTEVWETFDAEANSDGDGAGTEHQPESAAAAFAEEQLRASVG